MILYRGYNNRKTGKYVFSKMITNETIDQPATVPISQQRTLTQVEFLFPFWINVAEEGKQWRAFVNIKWPPGWLLASQEALCLTSHEPCLS